MIYGSVAYIGACFYGVQQMGVKGIIYANCLNLAIRGVSSLKAGKVSILILTKVATHKIYLGLTTAGIMANLVLK